MRIGFTYDMKEEYLALGYTPGQVAEMDSRRTIDLITGALEHHGHSVDPIGGLRALVDRLTQGGRWDCVFNIAEGLGTVSREAQVPALLEAYGIPVVFSSAWTMLVTLDKALTKTVLKEAGVPTPPWRTLHYESGLNSVDLAYPLFVKPLGEGSSIGVEDYSLVHDMEQLRASSRVLWAKHNQPLLVETFLSGREFTVGVLGTGSQAHAIGVMERHLDKLDKSFARSFANKEIDHENQDFYSLRKDALGERVAELALASWAAVKGRDAGRVDIRCDGQGEPFVLEINALAGLTPGYSDLCILAQLAGLDYNDLIGAILQEFSRRSPPMEDFGKLPHAAE
jgi:D-alanine-D-alanine ligase